jgi:hypothetical protein
VPLFDPADSKIPESATTDEEKKVYENQQKVGSNRIVTAKN